MLVNTITTPKRTPIIAKELNKKNYSQSLSPPRLDRMLNSQQVKNSVQSETLVSSLEEGECPSKSSPISSFFELIEQTGAIREEIQEFQKLLNTPRKLLESTKRCYAYITVTKEGGENEVARRDDYTRF